MDRRTRDNQQPISAGRFHRQGAGHDHTNAYSDREPKCDTNGNCYTHCYRNRDGYTHRYCHCYGYSYRDRDSYSYGNRYTHCYCYSYSYAHATQLQRQPLQQRQRRHRRQHQLPQQPRRRDLRPRRGLALHQGLIQLHIHVRGTSPYAPLSPNGNAATVLWGVRALAVFPETPHRAVATVPDRLDTARRLQGDSLIVFAYPASRLRNRTWALSQSSVPGTRTSKSAVVEVLCGETNTIEYPSRIATGPSSPDQQQHRPRKVQIVLCCASFPLRKPCNVRVPTPSESGPGHRW